jgi:hypothetical protein
MHFCFSKKFAHASIPPEAYNILGNKDSVTRILYHHKPGQATPMGNVNTYIAHLSKHIKINIYFLHISGSYLPLPVLQQYLQFVQSGPT